MDGERPQTPETQPATVHPAIAPLSYLLGIWRGKGEGGYPTISSFTYGEELHFSSIPGKPVIAYSQKTWKLSSGEPMHAESGYWRPKPDGSIDVVISQSTGLVEVQKGTYNAENKIINLQSQLVGNASKHKIITVNCLIIGKLYSFCPFCIPWIVRLSPFYISSGGAASRKPGSFSSCFLLLHFFDPLLPASDNIFRYRSI